MTECIGLFGKWFGHKFRTHYIYPGAKPNFLHVVTENYSEFLKEYYELRDTVVPVVYCKRCGKRPE